MEYRQDVCKVASIHFAPVTAKRNFRGAAYGIDAVELNKDPKILICRTLVQRDEGPYQMGPGGGKRQKLQYVVPAIDIAHDLVGHWTGKTIGAGGMTMERHPGIWVVRDRVPVIEHVQKMVDGENVTSEERMALDADGFQSFRPATEEEFKAMWAEDLAHARMADRAYAEWCWQEGNRIATAWKNPGKEPVPREMPPVYKMAARQYGLEADWLKEAAAFDSRLCPNCGAPGNVNHWMCQTCGQPVDLEKWAEWQAQKDFELERARKRVKSGALPPPVNSPAGQQQVTA